MLNFTLPPFTNLIRSSYQGFGAVIGDELVIVERNRLVATFAAGWVVSRQDSFERFAKFRVEDGVDDGVESGVGVAQPGEDLEGDVRDAGLAESCHDVDAEEGDPADEENAHYYACTVGLIVYFL